MNDDELLAHLKATDPALTSKAPRPDVTRLVEATMNTTTVTKDTTATKDARPRRRLVPALAFSALLLVGGGITWNVAQDGGPDTADPRKTTAAPLTLTLADGGSIAPMCAELTLDFLRRYPLAFEGTVTAKQGDRVDLRVDHWYRDDTATHAKEVRLTNDEANSEATFFRVGAHYLVTAENGVVPVCGGTGEASDEGRGLFREAFETSGK